MRRLPRSLGRCRALCLFLALVALGGLCGIGHCGDDEIYAGDSVRAVRDGVEFGLRDEDAITLSDGQTIQVTEVRSEWVGGFVLLNNVKHTGWIHRNEVELVIDVREPVKPIHIAALPDDADDVQTLKRLGVVLETGADGAVISADATGTPLSDDELRQVSKLHHLSTLQLAECRVSDQGLRHLVQLSGLQELYLDKTQISDDGMEYVGKLSNLEVLTLSGSKVQGTCLESLSGLQYLRVLNLSNCKVTDESLVAIKNLPRLEVLVLAGTGVTSDGLSHLRTLTPLRVLNLNDTKIKANALEHLHGLQELRMLYLRGTEITFEDTTALRDANPSLAIYTTSVKDR